MSGHGTIISSNGDKYIGNWLSGRRDGVGEYLWVEGDYYKGDWQYD